MNAYAYRALEGPEYIRLIVLHPALSKVTPLRIDFVSSKLEDVEGDYDAVSYTWGKPVLTFPLHVGLDGMQVHVTENLDRALRYLRYENRTRMLWADAACINQKDNEEKAIQIPLMVQIFRGARRVMAWLDPGGDTTVEQKGMRLLDRLSRLSKTTTRESYKDFSTILQFLHLPWFNRLWIVQEVVFNLEVCLICGETELPFSRLVSALSVIKPQDPSREPSRTADLEAIMGIGRLWNLYSLFREQQSALKYYTTTVDAGILHLLERFWSYECTDPRDRIFALCSMTTDIRSVGDSGESDGSYFKDFPTNTADDRLRETDENLPNPITTATYLPYQISGKICININYSLDIRETYEAFALACLMGSENANRMWEALLMRQHSPLPIDWPSWVPDWRVPPQKNGRGYHRDASLDFNFRRIATGILRVTVPVTRSILDRKEKQLYTVSFKIMKETKGSQMSLGSQLFQLHQMLQMPETLQGPHHLPIEPASTIRKLNPMDFPNLLVEMIRIYVSDCDIHNFLCGRHIYSELEEYLARTSIEPNLQCSPKLSSEDIRGFIKGLAHVMGNSTTLFCFRDPGTGVNSVGYGNMALELGDILLPLHSRLRILNRDGLTVEHVLILRPVHTMGISHGEKQTYKLIGDAYIFDPTAVLIGMEKKRRYKEIPRADLDAQAHRTWEEEYEEEKALLSSLDCQTFNQVVYLA
jgi:hypothetical protein